MSVYVSGSLAFDRIMTFKGNLHDHILTDKLRMISVSFMVDSMDERRGGCAGNIAYSLSLLGEKPVLVAAAGRDFDGYGRVLEKQGVSLEGVRRVPDVLTALCYLTSELNGNQITGFYPGAMNTPSDYAFPHLDATTDLGIVSPGNMEDMRRLPAFYREKGVRYIYDPGQQLPVLDKEDLAAGIEGSFACVTNDYELSMVCKKLDLREEDLLGKTRWLVTTLGAEGQRVRSADGTDVRIPALPCRKVADPTGAGDAHRAGLLAGIAHGLSVPEAAKIGAVSATYAIEHVGTQEHAYSREAFVRRYEEAFDRMPVRL